MPPSDESEVSVSAVSFPGTPPDSFPLPLFESLSGFSEESFPEEPLSVEPSPVEVSLRTLLKVISVPQVIPVSVKEPSISLWFKSSSILVSNETSINLVQLELLVTCVAIFTESVFRLAMEEPNFTHAQPHQSPAPPSQLLQRTPALLKVRHFPPAPDPSGRNRGCAFLLRSQ